MIAQSVVSPARHLPLPGLQDQAGVAALPGREDKADSVTAVFARITSGRAQPEDYSRYVALWDTLQARQWRRGAKAAGQQA